MFALRSFLATLLLIPGTSSFAEDIAVSVARDGDRLIQIFKDLHQNPELAFQEVETAALIARELRANGFEVHEGIGETGVVGILVNGDGPVVMVRADMDGLPIREETDLPYKSTAIKTDADGKQVPTMHACGHDAHVTWLIGVAKQLADRRDDWNGTLVLVGQPAEELITGAVAMVEDGLYDVAPQPDVIIAAHNYPFYPARSVAIGSGRRMAGTDQIDVIIHGVGGHGSTPNAAKDPVIMGAMATLGYQAVVSRVVDQYQPSVLTVGAFQAGDTNNIIPDSATLKLNLRWYREIERDALISGIRSVTDNIARMYNMPADGMPEYIMKGYATPVINAPEDHERAKAAMVVALGPDRVLEGIPPLMGSEDFQMLASPFDDVKVVLIEVGGGEADAYTNLMEQGRLPAFVNHNSRFEVDLQAVPSGTIALTAVALEYLDD